MNNQANHWKELIELLGKANNDKKLSEVLQFFLTADEREQLGSRLVLTKQLLAGELTQRQISETYNISIAKITRGSNELKRVEPEFREYLREFL